MDLLPLLAVGFTGYTLWHAARESGDASSKVETAQQNPRGHRHRVDDRRRRWEKPIAVHKIRESAFCGVPQYELVYSDGGVAHSESDGRHSIRYQ